MLLNHLRGVTFDNKKDLKNLLNNFFDNEEWAASVEISPNKKVGVLPPGMISNEEDFFIQQGPSQNDPEN